MTSITTQPKTDVINLTDHAIAWATPELAKALAAFDDTIDLIEGASLGFTPVAA